MGIELWVRAETGANILAVEALTASPSKTDPRHLRELISQRAPSNDLKGMAEMSISPFHGFELS
jgi:hypothetical protein